MPRMKIFSFTFRVKYFILFLSLKLTRRGICTFAEILIKRLTSVRDQRNVLIEVEQLMSKEINIVKNMFRLGCQTQWEYEQFFRGVLPELQKNFDELVSVRDVVYTDSSNTSSSSSPGNNVNQREDALFAYENLMSMFCYMLMCVPSAVLRTQGMLEKTANYMLNADMGSGFTTKVMFYF